MLSIGKLGHGQESYYLDTVASGAEDYYIGRGEAPGRWLGSMTVELGLDGRVSAEHLRQVLAGVDPISGDRFARGGERRVPGFDLTFCAPKSVSVLWGLGEREVSAVVRAAHDHSVDAALAYLEGQACWSRRGTNGFVHLRGDGFVGAAFRHRTSRAGDPHLHSHVVVANATRSADGWRGALDARHLYLHAKTAGYLYEAHLRAELTVRLGVEWTPVVNGIADIVGISEAVLDRFSTRRHEIEAELAERGESSARAAQYAVLETRQAKDYDVDPLLLHGLWAEQIAELGWDRDQLETVLGKTSVEMTDAHVQMIGDRLLGPDGLTKQASTFDRRAVIRAWCGELTAGADISVIERLADKTLADPRVVPLQPSQHGSVGTMRRRANGRAIDTPTTGPRYSTQDLLDLEGRLVDRAIADADQPLGIADEDSVVAALTSRPTLSEEQLEMVATLTTSGRAVDVVIAAAGTGKTFSLDAARDAWRRSGNLVLGTALAARAAAELETTAGIPSHTITSLLADLDRGARGPFPPKTILVVDEAGMVGTRQLARVLDHAAAAHAKVVLVGDPRQLPEIDAGGLLRGLGARMPTIRLAENRRQRESWERDALAQLRDGHVDDAVAAYHEHGRIRTDRTAPAARNAMTADWWAATLAGDRVLMLATRWSDVDDLNARARAHLHEAGKLSGPVLTVDERPYQAGDRIMTLRNDRRLGVRNGTCATITDIDVVGRQMTVRTDTGTELVLPPRYLDAGHVRHAYATTIHKAQGQTVDRAFVLGSDTLYQEAGYVALSRGRAENRIYLSFAQRVCAARLADSDRSSAVMRLARALPPTFPARRPDSTAFSCRSSSSGNFVSWPVALRTSRAAITFGSRSIDLIVTPRPDTDLCTTGLPRGAEAVTSGSMSEFTLRNPDGAPMKGLLVQVPGGTQREDPRSSDPMQRERPRRQQKRIQLGGSVRLLVDTPNGLITTNGQIIDLSEGGCAIRIHRHVDANLPGRINVEIAGKALGLPVRTRWSRADSRGWTVGCQFDRPTPEKQHAIRALILERRRLTA